MQRLASAYDSIKEKVQTINQLQGEKADLEIRLAAAESHVLETAEQARTEERKRAEAEINRLHDLVRMLRETNGSEIERRVASIWSPDASSSVSTLVSPIEGSPFGLERSHSVGHYEQVRSQLLKSWEALLHCRQSAGFSNGIDHVPISRPQTASATHSPTSNLSFPSASTLRLSTTHGPENVAFDNPFDFRSADLSPTRLILLLLFRLGTPSFLRFRYQSACPRTT